MEDLERDINIFCRTAVARRLAGEERERQELTTYRALPGHRPMASNCPTNRDGRVEDHGAVEDGAWSISDRWFLVRHSAVEDHRPVDHGRRIEYYGRIEDNRPVEAIVPVARDGGVEGRRSVDYMLGSRRC